MCTSCDFHVCPDWENAVLVLLTHRDRPTPLNLPWDFLLLSVWSINFAPLPTLRLSATQMECTAAIPPHLLVPLRGLTAIRQVRRSYHHRP